MADMLLGIIFASQSKRENGIALSYSQLSNKGILRVLGLRQFGKKDLCPSQVRASTFTLLCVKNSSIIREREREQMFHFSRELSRSIRSSAFCLIAIRRCQGGVEHQLFSAWCNPDIYSCVQLNFKATLMTSIKTLFDTLTLAPSMCTLTRYNRAKLVYFFPQQ